MKYHTLPKIEMDEIHKAYLPDIRMDEIHIAYQP
jgi:hypothetical protein